MLMGLPTGLAWSPRRTPRTFSLSLLLLVAAMMAGTGLTSAAPQSLAAHAVTSPSITVAPSSHPASASMPRPTAPADAGAMYAKLHSDPHPSWLPNRAASAAPALTKVQIQAQLAQASHSLSLGAGPAHGVSVTCTSTGSSSDQCGSATPAVGAETWQNASYIESFYYGTPAETYYASMAFDAYDGYVVFFGGCDYIACPDNQTWAFEYGVWYNIGAEYPSAPPATYEAAMDYDSNFEVVLLYGGCSNSACPDNYTWYFTGEFGWTNLTALLGAAPDLDGASMVFAADSDDGYSVLFGGCTTGDCYPLDNVTYGFSGSSWVPISTSTSPPELAGEGLVFDPVLNATLMFGGCMLYSCDLNTTWEYDDFNWDNLTSFLAIFGPTPAGRGFAAITWDSLDNDVVMYGGFGDGFQILGDTWTFTCPFFCQWNNVTVAGTIPALAGAAMPAISNDTIGTMLNGGEFVADGTAYLSNGTYFYEPQFSISPIVPSGAPARSLVNVSTNPSGGAGDYFPDFYGAFWWYGSNYSYNLNESLNFTWPATYTLNLLAYDDFGVNILQQFTVVATGPTTQISGGTSTDVGMAVALTASAATGGNAPYNYTWSFGDTTTGYGPSVDHTWTAAGTYPVVVEVTDSENLTYNATYSVTVSATPAVTVSASRAVFDVGQSATFTPAVTGGTSPVSYNWTFGDGTSASTTTAPTHVFATSGSYKVTLNITDSVGGAATASITVTVNTAVGGSASVSSASVTTGTTDTFTATATGGTSPYTYAWVFGDGKTGTGASATHAYAAPGTFTAKAWINDSVGGSFAQLVTVTVTSTSTGNGGHGGSNTSSTGLSNTTLGIIVAVIVIVVVAAIALMVMRRKPKSGTPSDPPSGAAGSSTPPPPGPVAPWAESPPPPGAGGSA
jgi:PKD repeat protein